STLACLDKFLDERRVWVFQFSAQVSLHPSLGRLDNLGLGSTNTPKAVLTKMKDLADIWGPVHCVPHTVDLFRHYVVSKGVIRRAPATQRSATAGAVNCHYFPRSSFCRRAASKLLPPVEDLLLSPNDLLLIGAGFHQNQWCEYKLANFREEYAAALGVLGTRDSFWKADTRSVTVGFSRTLGVTLSGSQKLIPATTRKQHILDSWSTNPSTRNPGILNQYLGIEISHCTGNARRIPLRQVLTSQSVWPILERMSPDWRSRPWGAQLSEALLGDDDEAIFGVWREFASSRTEIAELFRCVIELLNGTGWDENDSFHAALLSQSEELDVPIPTGLNDWCLALRDTPTTSAYVIMNEICLNCEVLDHSTSTCQIPLAFTVLETSLVTEKGAKGTGQGHSFKLKPSGECFRHVDDERLDIMMLTRPLRSSFTGSLLRELVSGRTSTNCHEVYSMNHNSPRNLVCLRASKHSVRGRSVPVPARRNLTSRLRGQTLLGGVLQAPPQEDAAQNEQTPTRSDAI
ncbi:MAG: hypothetical protein M1831_000794, partial [Alyxoria varia]